MSTVDKPGEVPFHEKRSTIQRILRQVHEAHVPFPNFLQHDGKKTVSLIGAPMTYGQGKPGTDHGPRMMREGGLVRDLNVLNWEVRDRGDLVFEPPSVDDPPVPLFPGAHPVRNSLAVGRGCEALHKVVLEEALAGNFVATLGGDHSIGAGSVSAILKARPDTGIIWVDAHGDINTPETTQSGNMHGMPVALLLRQFPPEALPGFEWMKGLPVLKPNQIAFIGLRDIDEGERRFLKDLGILAMTMHHVDKFGIGGVMARVLDHLEHRPLHLSYDIDAVDPVHAPSTGTAVRGGLTLREAHFVAEAVSETGLLGSLDMVELNPTLGCDEEAALTVEMSLGLISSALGSRIL